MLLEYYLEKLNYKNKPEFINKYLNTPSLLRLKKVGYFCGMDYASKNIYNFKEHITRYDHSLTVALLTWKFTQNKIMTLAGLFHDIATPCFSHVIDYMNKDYENQESTEEYTEKILKSDEYLIKCLKEDNIDIEDIINFKNYSIVDNDRPKLCADRLDGVILTGISWTTNVDYDEIDKIMNDIKIYKNEDNLDEIGFKTMSVAKLVLDISKSIDVYCHSNEDNYMMELLAEITRAAIENKIITYDELYLLDEEDLFKKLKSCEITYIRSLIQKFETVTKSEIPDIQLDNVKIRKLDPIVDGKRYSFSNEYNLWI